MKKLLSIIALITLFSCAPEKVSEVAAFEFNNSWYWIIQYQDGATQQDVEAYAKKWANPEQTSHFFAFDNSIDLSVFKNEAFSLPKFTATVLAAKPKYGYYRMSTDKVLNDDAIWLLEQSQNR